MQVWAVGGPTWSNQHVLSPLQKLGSLQRGALALAAAAALKTISHRRRSAFLPPQTRLCGQLGRNLVTTGGRRGPAAQARKTIRRRCRVPGLHLGLSTDF